jgi:hypothetical protein
MWDERSAPSGWKRVIRYNNKEYDEVIKRVAKLRERLDVRADHCEKVAWVLGKEGIDLNFGAEVDVSVQEEEETKEDPAVKASTKQPKATPKGKGTKRKANEAKTAVQEVRKSSRRKVDTYYGEN